MNRVDTSKRQKVEELENGKARTVVPDKLSASAFHLQAVLPAASASGTVVAPQSKRQPEPRARKLDYLLAEVQGDGLLALKVAKACELLPLPDALVYFSQVRGFFNALSDDDQCEGLIRSVAEAWNETREDQFSSFLQRFAIGNVQALGVLLKVTTLPVGLMESVLEARLSKDSLRLLSDSDWVVLEKVVDALGMNNCYEMLHRIVLNNKLVVVESIRLFLMKVLTPGPTKTNRFLSQCADWIGACIEENTSGAMAFEVGACAFRLAQTACRHPTTDDEDVEEYSAFCSTVFQDRVKSASEFRKAIQCLDLLVSADPAWALKAQRKAVNGSQLRQMKCRATYVELVRTRLATVPDNQDVNISGAGGLTVDPKKELNELLALFITSGNPPARLKLLRLKRPDFFQSELLPLVTAPSIGKDETQELFTRRQALALAIKREWPPRSDNGPLLTREDASAAMPVAAEVVQRIVALLTPSTHLQRIDTMRQEEFAGYFASTRKDVMTFCALADSPSYSLASAAIHLFRSGSFTSQRYRSLQRLFLFQSDSFIVTAVLLQMIAEEILFNQLWSKNPNLVLQLIGDDGAESNKIERSLFERMAVKSCSMAAPDMCLKTLGFFASWRRKAKWSQETILPVMLWLRWRVEACMLDPLTGDATRTELDDFDSVAIGCDSKFFSTPTEFFHCELQCSASSSSLRRARFIAQIVKERFDYLEAFQAAVKVMLHLALTNGDLNAVPTSDIVLALMMLFHEDHRLQERSHETFVSVWKQVYDGAKEGDTTRMTQMILCAMETYFALFGPQKRISTTFGQLKDEFGVSDAPPEPIAVLMEQVFRIV